MPPDVFVDTEHRHRVQAMRIVGEHPKTLVEHGGIRGVPADPEIISNPSDRQVVNDERG